MTTILVTGATLVVALVLAIIFRAWIRAVIERLAEALGWVWFVIMWTYPPILYGLGWSMHGIVQFIAKTVPGFESSIGMELLFLTCFGVLGAGVQWITSSNPNTRLGGLISDHVASVVWFGVTLTIAVYAYATNTSAYWLTFPAIYTLVELLLTGISGLRNAFQKNPTQAQLQPQ